MEFKDRLVKIRRSKHKSQADLSNEIGISLRGYKNYESGARMPKDRTVFKIAEVLGVNPNVLLSDEEYYAYINGNIETSDIDKAKQIAIRNNKSIELIDDLALKKAPVLAGILMSSINSIPALAVLGISLTSSLVGKQWFKTKSKKEISDIFIKAKARCDAQYLECTMDLKKTDAYYSALKDAVFNNESKDLDISYYKKISVVCEKFSLLQSFVDVLEEEKKCYNNILHNISKYLENNDFTTLDKYVVKIKQLEGKEGEIREKIKALNDETEKREEDN